MSDKSERLQKVMAEAGIASRRACEKIITEGRVRVNGRIVTELGTRVRKGRDRIEVDNQLITAEPLKVIVLNKPRGVVSTANDPEGRETVVDLVKDAGGRLFPVGRLDYNTSGALLLTNDGDLAHALTPPKFGAETTNHMKVDGRVTEEVLEQWRTGVTLDDFSRTRPAKEVFIAESTDGFTWLQITIREGKNRQSRRMAEATGLRVSKLKRIAFAGITIEKLPIGTWRHLSEQEMYRLKRDYINPARRSLGKSPVSPHTDAENDGAAAAQTHRRQQRSARVPRGWGGTSEPAFKSRTGEPKSRTGESTAPQKPKTRAPSRPKTSQRATGPARPRPGKKTPNKA